MKLDEAVTVGSRWVKVGGVVTLGFVIALAVGEVTSVLQPARAVQASTVLPVQDALQHVTDAIRSAWLVRPEATDRLVVVDSQGSETRFFGMNGRLVVRRPDGRSGVLLGGLRDVAFRTSTQRDLRQGEPVSIPGTVWRHAAKVSAPLVLPPGTSLSLGLTLNSRAPGEIPEADGVPEQLLRCEPLWLVLDAAGLPPRHTPCAVHATHAGGPRQPVRDVLVVSLHEGFAPGDARPFGPAIASVSVPFTKLARGPGSERGTEQAGDECWLCPVDVSEMSAVTSSDLPLDLSGMRAVLAPGRAYSVVLSVKGSTPLVIGAAPVARPGSSGAAFRARQEPVFDPVPWQIPARLDGNRVYTRTVPHDVVDRVSVILSWDDGRHEVAEALVNHVMGGRDDIRSVARPESVGVARWDAQTPGR